MINIIENLENDLDRMEEINKHRKYYTMYKNNISNEELNSTELTLAISELGLQHLDTELSTEDILDYLKKVFKKKDEFQVDGTNIKKIIAYVDNNKNYLEDFKLTSYEIPNLLGNVYLDKDIGDMMYRYRNCQDKLQNVATMQSKLFKFEHLVGGKIDRLGFTLNENTSILNLPVSKMVNVNILKKINSAKEKIIHRFNNKILETRYIPLGVSDDTVSLYTLMYILTEGNVEVCYITWDSYPIYYGDLNKRILRDNYDKKHKANAMTFDVTSEWFNYDEELFDMIDGYITHRNPIEYGFDENSVGKDLMDFLKDIPSKNEFITYLHDNFVMGDLPELGKALDNDYAMFILRSNLSDYHNNIEQAELGTVEDFIWPTSALLIRAYIAAAKLIVKRKND